ncbi:MAG: hypothetical protein WA843_00505 [Candidatus Saccharimonadales bacterium]
MMRYFIGFIVTLGLIIILILLLVTGGGSKSKTSTAPKTLTSYVDTDAEVRLLVDGPVNADQIHQRELITVGRYNVTFQQMQGYDNAIVNTQSYPSTRDAYAAFLHSLQHAGFTNVKTDPKLADERGYCPLGNRYVFELRQNDADIERYWATSCGKPKTFPGNTDMVITLFKAQIPDYDTLTQNINIAF